MPHAHEDNDPLAMVLAKDGWTWGYMSQDMHNLTDFHGNVIASAKVVATWRRLSYVSTHLHQVEAVIDGVTYTGRTAGGNMEWRGRPKANRRGARS